MTKTIIKKYSTAFKKQVVWEYENGATLYELDKKYGITGRTTIKKWVQKYSRKGVRHKLMVIQTPEEQNENKELKKKIAQLEKAVAQLTLDKLMLESTLEVVEEELGELPKKSGEPGSSSEPGSEAEQKDTP